VLGIIDHLKEFPPVMTGDFNGLKLSALGQKRSFDAMQRMQD